MSRRVPKALRLARKHCADEMEPLWRPAAWMAPRTNDLLERADRQSVAKRAAFAWLSAQLGVTPFETFDAVSDIAVLRRAWAILWNATLFDVRRWQDQVEQAA